MLATKHYLWIRRMLRLLLTLVIVAVILFLSYFNNTSLSDKNTSDLYYRLKDTLESRGYPARLLVISTKRIALHNTFQVWCGGAATKSRHLDGEAIDFLVFDVNKDGNADANDVDLVYRILDRELMKGTGGIGTYKGEAAFIDRQMIHIDRRKKRARW